MQAIYSTFDPATSLKCASSFHSQPAFASLLRFGYCYLQRRSAIVDLCATWIEQCNYDYQGGATKQIVNGANKISNQKSVVILYVKKIHCPYSSSMHR